MEAMQPNPEMAPRRGRPPGSTNFNAGESTAPEAAPTIIGRKIDAVQFYTGVQFLALVKTGLNVKKDICRIVLVGPGVWIEIGGREYIVPFANVMRIDLAAG